jgi:SH3-like domain-containing protein
MHPAAGSGFLLSITDQRMKTKALILAFIFVLFAGHASAERLAVKAAVANVRSGPGTQYDIIWKVERYHPLQVVKKSDRWIQFRDFEDDIGWIHGSLVADIPAVITRSDRCNIRSGAGTKFSILLTVERGIPFKVLKRQGKWLQVLHADGDQGWIHKSLVW